MDDAFPDRFVLKSDEPLPTKTRWRGLVWFVGLASLLVVSSCAYVLVQYNALQREDEFTEAQWGFVLNQYTRRADLVPNLVTVVKSYATGETRLFATIAHERAQLTALANAAVDNHDIKQLDEFQKAQNRLATQLGQLLVVSERYPSLQSSDLYRDLMAQLEGCENRIAYARERYITAIASYNALVRSFPSSLIAARAGNQVRPRFTVENVSSVSKPPQLDLK